MLRNFCWLSWVAFTPNQPVCQKWMVGVESILAMPGFRKRLLVKPFLIQCHLRAECFFARSDVHLFAIGCIFNVCAFEWKRCLWLFATSGSPGWEEAAAALKLCCSLLHRSTLPAQPCTFKLLLLLLLRVLSTGFQSLNNISVLLYSIRECKYFVISQMVRGECALLTMRTQWCICWHILLWCGYMQGCINCAILLSGIRASGVSSEHMENMEMFSCSPT